VLDKGEIVASGSHAELMAAGGIYRRLYDLQFNRNPDEPGAEVELLAAATA
jgi:subfamily B ATP-binding cassette protein MsbA